MTALHSVIAGEGEPVILLHSGGMSSRQWRKLAERLAPSHRAIAPDFLGAGKSPPWPDDRPFDFALDVDAVEELARGLGEAVHLVGHSYGGLVALTLARRAPASVRSIAVYDPVAFGALRAAGDREGLADLARAEGDPVWTDDVRGGGDEWYRAFVDWWQGRGTWDSLGAEARASFLRVGRKVYREVRSLMLDGTPAEAYRAIDAPALLLHGARSPIAARRVVELLGAAMPRATVRAIEGAGHMGPITHAGVVEEAIVDHLARAR